MTNLLKSLPLIVRQINIFNCYFQQVDTLPKGNSPSLGKGGFLSHNLTLLTSSLCHTPESKRLLAALPVFNVRKSTDICEDDHSVPAKKLQGEQHSSRSSWYFETKHLLTLRSPLTASKNMNWLCLQVIVQPFKAVKQHFASSLLSFTFNSHWSNSNISPIIEDN